MSEKKETIIETIGKMLPSMTEEEKIYLMSFLEGSAAIVRTNQMVAERPGA